MPVHFPSESGLPAEASHGRRCWRTATMPGAGFGALGISFSRREYRCRSGLHRPGCGGSTPPSCRVWVANFDSEVPALNRRELGANPWRPTILRLELEQREGSKRRMSSIGSAKEDFPRAEFQVMDGGPCSTRT